MARSNSKCNPGYYRKCWLLNCIYSCRTHVPIFPPDSILYSIPQTVMSEKSSEKSRSAVGWVCAPISVESQPLIWQPPQSWVSFTRVMLAKVGNWFLAVLQNSTIGSAMQNGAHGMLLCASWVIWVKYHWGQRVRGCSSPLVLANVNSTCNCIQDLQGPVLDSNLWSPGCSWSCTHFAAWIFFPFWREADCISFSSSIAWWGECSGIHKVMWVSEMYIRSWPSKKWKTISY